MLLDSDVWAARASEAVGRDFTQTEWDVYVPGDLPLTPARTPEPSETGLDAEALACYAVDDALRMSTAQPATINPPLSLGDEALRRLISSHRLHRPASGSSPGTGAGRA